jgi:hypothetical protein
MYVFFSILNSNGLVVLLLLDGKYTEAFAGSGEKQLPLDDSRIDDIMAPTTKSR